MRLQQCAQTVLISRFPTHISTSRAPICHRQECSMRKVVVLTFLSLDGVMQAPGGPEEDTEGGFKFGGWTAPYMDEFAGKVMSKQMDHDFDLLLGRKTFDIFERYW